MSEEKKIPSPTPEKDENKTAETAEVSKEVKQKKSERSVVRYISVLFAAAFVLLLVTFMMEARQYQQAMSESQAQIEDLNDKNNSAVNRLNDTIEENEKLKQQLAEYEEHRSTWFDEKEQLQAYAFDMKKTTQAMDWFWQIDEAYTQKRYTLAQQLIEKFEATGLQELLPTLSSTGTDRLSPAERYAEIRDKVM